MILDVQTVTIHHPQKTSGHLHPSAPPITVMTSAEGRQAKQGWWPTAVDLLDICVCLHVWCQTSRQPALIFCSNTMVSQLEGQFTPKSKDVRLLFSVMELDGTGYGVQNIEKNSTVSLSGNHNLVPRDNPQALNYFLSVSLHRRKRASTHQASCQAANPTVKVKWLLFDQCRPITFGKSGRS